MPYSLHKIDTNMKSCPNAARITAQIKTAHIMTHSPKRFLRSSAMSALTACLLGISAHSAAQTTIDSETTTPLSTSSSGDTTITEDGTITLTDDTGPAITLDSNNDVTNDGAIAIEASGTTTGVDNATAIILQGGADRNFTNTGSIVVGDNFAPSNTDDDALLDGPFAQGQPEATLFPSENKFQFACSVYRHLMKQGCMRSFCHSRTHSIGLNRSL